MNSNNHEHFLKTTKTLADLIVGLSWISTAVRLRDFEIKDLHHFFQKFESLIQMIISKITVEPTQSFSKVHDKKLVNLNGVDMGEKVNDTLVQLRTSIQDCLSILTELESQHLIPFMEENLFSRFQSQYVKTHTLSKELFVLFDSYEVVVI